MEARGRATQEQLPCDRTLGVGAKLPNLKVKLILICMLLESGRCMGHAEEIFSLPKPQGRWRR